MTRFAAYVVGLLVFAACHREPDSSGPELTPEERKRLVAQYEKKKRELALGAASSRNPPAASPRPSSSAGSAPSDAPVAAPPRDEQSSAVSEASDDGPWLLDEPVGVAPAGPLTATSQGVVLYDRTNGLHFGRLGGLSRRSRPMKTPISRPPGVRRRFPLGRGPAVTSEHAYWITEGRLLRRRIPYRGEEGPLEVLATDAQTGTRVAALALGSKGPSRVAVAYITRPAKPDGPLRAKLWVEGGETQALTPEGNSTHSVALAQAGEKVIALSMQARMAMTPVHARVIQFDKDRPRLGPDVVAWVGGGVQPLTEMPILVHGATHLWGFIPHERSITEFGLAVLDVGQEPDMNTPTEWILYPNGIDPAPVATGHICGRPAVLYAQPQNAEPDAPQELVLRTVGAVVQLRPVANAKAFYSVSMAEVPGGALIAYVADWASWARTVRCR